MAKSLGPVAECPPCGIDSLLPMCRALSVASAGVGEAQPSAAAKSDAWRASQSDEAAVVFSVRPPRDAIAGLASGAKTVLRSVVAGATAFRSGPCDGINKGDPLGALCGLVEGSAAALILPSAGVLIGAAQCLRGVANTPAAVAESVQGKQWCSEKRQWAPAVYNLREEARELRRRHAETKAARAAASAAKEAASAAGARPTEDCGTDASGRDEVTGGESTGGTSEGTSSAIGPRRCVLRPDNYYRLLQVHPSATSTEIRRAYYRESRRCHPDKAGSDRRTVARFQQVSEAYKVLRSPELRRAYDRGGTDEVTRMATTVDLGALYSAVLSGGQWVPFVGELALSRLLAAPSANYDCEESALPGGRGDGIMEAFAELWLASETSSGAWQTGREVRCAMALATRLQPAVEGASDSDFECSLREEAQRLAAAPFAPGLMRVVASVYESEASRFLGTLRLLDPRREVAQVCAQGRLLACQAQAATAGLRAALALRTLLEEEANEAGSREATPDKSGESAGEPKMSSLCLERPAVQAQLPALAAALWSLTVLDVEGTLRRVCRRVLRDLGEQLPGRVARAQALLVAARVLRDAADAREGLPASGLPGAEEELLRCRIQEIAARLAGASGTGGQGTSAAANSDDAAE